MWMSRRVGCVLPGPLVLMPWWDEGQTLQKGEGQLTLLFRGEVIQVSQWGEDHRAGRSGGLQPHFPPTFSALLLLSFVGNFRFHFLACSLYHVLTSSLLSPNTADLPTPPPTSHLPLPPPILQGHGVFPPALLAGIFWNHQQVPDFTNHLTATP